jgi:hypothetical protein
MYPILARRQNIESRATEANRAFRLRCVDSFPVLRDDDCPSVGETLGCGSRSRHEVFPFGWIMEARGFRGANGFALAALGQEVGDGRL